MANLNKVLLIGRLTRDPELRYTPGGLSIAEFGLAVNNFRKGQDGNRIEETVFVDMTAFGRQAETIHQYLGKGRQVFVEGKLRFEQWTNKEGQKRSKLSVTVDNLQFLDSKGDAPPDEDGGRSRPSRSQDSGMGDEPDYSQREQSDDDFPF